ncbi:MAG TPA: hypothetical protein VLK27_01195 [Chthoniobacterales bacterium]|nr:hypothetical protein [Chthoniobacterales bacterium]
MKPIKFRRVLVGIAFLVAGAISTVTAGTPTGGPSTPTLEGAPINGGGSSLGQGGAPSNLPGSVPGGNSYGGSNDTATSGVRERGVAGSGLPREKISVVDTKSLPSRKTDGKFDTSLLGSDLKSVGDVKSIMQKESSKSQSQTQKATASVKASEQTKTQPSTSTDSAKPADKH